MTYEMDTLRQLIRKLQSEHKQAFNELSKLPEGRLHQEKHDSRTYYYLLLGQGKERSRVGITKDRRLVYQMARKEYLLIAMRKLEQGIEVMNKISEKINFDAWQDATDDACNKFPALSPEVFILGEKYEIRPSKGSRMFLSGTIHRTQRGVMVRSKSELIIADMLESLGIPYQYEVELPYDDYHLCPDFTVIRPRDGMVIYWEHFGMTHDEEYLIKMDLKLDKYRNIGIRPWNNLMISYDKEDGSLDVTLVRALVEGWLR